MTSSFIDWACMRRQCIHVCSYHMHTHINTHIWGGLFEFCFQWLWLTENGVKSADYRCERGVVFNRRTSGARGMGWGSEWRVDQRSQHPTCRRPARWLLSMVLGVWTSQFIFRRAHACGVLAWTEEALFWPLPPGILLRLLGNPKEVGQPTEERDQIYHQRNACVSRADCHDIKHILVFFLMTSWGVPVVEVFDGKWNLDVTSACIK